VALKSVLPMLVINPHLFSEGGQSETKDEIEHLVSASEPISFTWRVFWRRYRSFSFFIEMNEAE